MYWTAGGGYGDPLDRDPEKVQSDVLLGNVSADAALQLYGVVLSETADRAVDIDATARTRQARRDPWRSAETAAVPMPALGMSGTRSVSNYLYVAERKDERSYCCARCSHSVAPLTGNYKLSCSVEECPASESNLNTPDTSLYVDESIVFRRFHCANCGGLIDTEIARAGDGPLWDIRID